MRILLLCLALLSTPLFASDKYEEIKWELLVPKGWDPAREFRGLDLSKLDDADPRAAEALQKLRETWDNAPTEAALDGRRIRLPGFIIPLERKGEQVVEFLLVPYFGACIHTPPPPANQIIHAVSSKPVGKMRTMDTVWVTGTLGIKRSETSWGHAGYRLTVDKVWPYEAPKRK
ncbi:MAG: DUF3299 domain-containing protein [Rhodocyclaceae bacterium]|nr:DUF3299 domain-containing protein [Rhodocyclaceae bacterium]